MINVSCLSSIVTIQDYQHSTLGHPNMTYLAMRTKRKSHMAKYTSIREFKPEVEEWPAYTERLQHYYTAYDVRNGDKKRAILLRICGPEMYGLSISSLVTLAKKVMEFLCAQLVEKVMKHYNPCPASAIVQRYKFKLLETTWRNGSTVAHFVTELHLQNPGSCGKVLFSFGQGGTCHNIQLKHFHQYIYGNKCIIYSDH